GIDFVTPQTGMIVGSVGHLLRTEDGGANWINHSKGYLGLGTLNEVARFDANHIIAVGNLGYTMYTSDAGRTWMTHQDLMLGSLRGVWMTSPTRAHAVGAMGIHVTDDGGQTWTQQATGILQGIYFMDANVGTAVGN